MISKKPIVESSGITNVGRKRKGNEDSYSLDDNLRLYVVADGMGGHQAGEVASKIVADIIQKMMSEYAKGAVSVNNIGSRNLSQEAAWLDSSISEANRLVYDLSAKVKEYKGMGSTVSAVFLAPDILIAANVGDSPIYLIRKDEVSLLSVPHTAMAEYEATAPPGSKPLSDKFRHVITRAMGSKESVDPDFSEIKPLAGDIVVLCSDGLSDKVKAKEIRDIVKSNPPSEAGLILVELANERGGEDNITIIVLKILEVPASSQTTGKTGTVQESVRHVIVEYDTDDFSGRVLVSNITLEGLFVEKAEYFTIGQKLVLTVSDINEKNSVMANAKVASITPRGVTLSFDNLTHEQKEKLESLLEYLTV